MASAESSDRSIAPISLSRAHAQASHPLADGTDTALLVAYVEGRCVGYLGFLRGLLRTPDGVHPLLWLSTWYVTPDSRSTGAGAALLLRAFSLREDIVVTGVSDEAAAVYKQMRFRELKPLEHIVLNMRRAFVPSLPLRAVRKLWRKATSADNADFDGAVNLADRLSARVLYPAVLRGTEQALSAFEVERVASIDAAAFDAGSTDRGTYFERPRELVNWMIANPWVVTDSARATRHYYFGDCHEVFEYVPVVFRQKNDGRVCGFAIFRLDSIFQTRSVTIFDHNLAGERDVAAMCALAIRYAATIGAAEVVLPQSARSWIDQLGLLGRMAEERQRAYYARPARRDSPLSQALESVELDLADGDLAFA